MILLKATTTFRLDSFGILTHPSYYIPLPYFKPLTPNFEL